MDNINLQQKPIPVLSRLLLTLTTATLLALTAWGSAPRAVSATTPRYAPPGQTLTQTVTSGPAFEQIVNLGVPVGNTTTPRHLALDSDAGFLYIAGDGIPRLGQGNDLSRFDIEAGEFVAHVKIPGQANPLDLQLDPATERLYLVRQAPLGSEVPASLSVIDSQSLEVLEEVPGVGAVAIAEGKLYAATLTGLTRYAVAGDALSVEAQAELPATSELAGLALNPAANRLYLARADSRGWGVEVYQADSLSLISAFATEDRITGLLPNPASQELLVFEALGGDRWVQRLDAAGRALAAPIRLSSATGGAGLALSPDGRQLYFSNDELPAPSPNPAFETVPTLVGVRADGFVPEINLPLPARFDDLVIDPAGNQAFALSPAENLLTVIDLNRPEVRPIATAREIRDLLVDPDSGDLFLSDSGGGLRRLAADTFAVQAKTQVEGAGPGGGLGAGELVLDSHRDRLYLSGYPAYTFEADTLTEQDTLRPGGQFSLDPGGEVVYLSACGLVRLDATRLISESVVPGSTRRPDQRVPNPCVGHSTLDAANGRLYSLAPNGVPGSNGGNLLYVYDVTLTPTLIFSDLAISAVQALPDPTHQRAFVRHQQGPVGTLRTLITPPELPPGYTHSLSGLAGRLAYSPVTDRLYLSDGTRLLTLAADTLAVIAEMPLPLNYDYRLVALDPDQEWLYLAGLDGQLLLAREEAGATRQENVTALTEAGADLFPPSRQPNGAILGLDPLPDDSILARIETDYDFQRDVRLFSTVDDGATWSDLSQGLPPGLQLQDVALLPGQTPTPTLLVALSSSQESSGGLYRSTDGGQSWQPAMAGLRDLAVNRLIVAAESEAGLLLANTVRAGLHLSRDRGQSWTAVTDLDPAALAQPLGFGAAAISNDGTVLVTRRSEANGSAGLYRATLSSTGALSAWELVLDQTLTRLAFAPDGQTVLAYAEGLWRSTDGGESWQPGGAGLTDLDISQADQFLFSPDFALDQTVYLFFRDIRGDTSGRLFRSTDGGDSWQTWDNPPVSQRFTTINLASAGDLLLGDDQTGLSRLPLSGLRWAEPSPPATPFPVDDLAVSPNFAADETLFALSHLHGLWRSTDGGDSWQRTVFPVRSTSFEGYRLALSPAYAEDQTLFIATGFSLHRTTDGGDSWQNLSLPDQAGFKAEQVALSPDFAQDQTLLTSIPTAILRSTDGGDRWEQVLLRPETAGSARLLGFAPDGTAYAWFDYDNTLFSSSDGGRRWQATPTDGTNSGEPVAVAGGLIAPDGALLLRPSFYPQLLLIDPQDATRHPLDNILPAGFGEIQTLTHTPDGTLLAGGSSGLLRSLDGGLTWQPARNAGPLAQADITQLYATETDLFVGLREGRLFRFDGEAASWQEISVIR